LTLPFGEHEHCAATLGDRCGDALRARSTVLAGTVNLSGPAALYWSVELRSKGPDQARPTRAVDYEQVFRDAAPGLWRAIYAFSAGQRAVADDAVAEAFARALERSGQIRDPVPWLYRTAFRLAAEDLRRDRREPEPERDHALASAAGLGALVPALRQLSPAQRAAVVLYYEADLSVREVARQMGTSVAVVKVHLFRGRRRLRDLLGDEEADDG
jgi:RNA polymerase sigma-70 factor (ECF subfamily)